MSTTTDVQRGPLIERPEQRPAGPADLRRDLGPRYVANAFIGLIFGASGPVAVILGVGLSGGLSAAELASWLFGVFFVGGLLSLVSSLVYRQPLGFAFTIPGVVLVGPALQHLSWAEVIGAFFVTGVLCIVLGATGLVRKLMDAIPMPIVMAMVAGVFLKFGTDLVGSVQAETLIAGSMVVAYVLLTRIPRLGKYLPPVMGALITGAVAIAITGKFNLAAGGLTQIFAAPTFTAPQWSLQAMIELVVPLTITVLVVQNGQGYAVLRQNGHNPPVTVSAIASGIGSVLNATVGASPACLTGPTNALLTASGTTRRHYTAGASYGVICIAFALVAPAVTAILLATPTAFILALGGLAMLPSLRVAFVTSFHAKYTMGALITFVVTVSGLTVLNIGSAFWGLVIGYLASRLLEWKDHRSGAAAH